MKQCDEDGFGVEPDDYMYGVVDPEGVFIEPFYVAWKQINN